MQQRDYEIIVNCISFGAPALADSLVKTFNDSLRLAAERITELQEEDNRQNELKIKAMQEQQILEESKNTKVIKK